MKLICPVCGKPLELAGRSYICGNRHCYDLAKSSYVNLLPPSPGGKRHGDDKLMVSARTEFLSRGYYGHLEEAVAALADECTRPGDGIVDAGCGEGTYTKRVYDRLLHSGKAPDIVGVDISVEALKRAARLVPGAVFCAASTAHMPLESESAGLILNIFSPFMAEEFRRVLRPGGHLIRVMPLERHLWELKALIYDTPYENPPADLDARGFRILRQQEARRVIELPTADAVQALFRMTPYYYKTGRADQQKLENIDRLSVSTEFGLTVYERL